MSRRPNPAADRAAQNQQTLKSLVKLESNKSCADCKRNKHPRWASWNLGIFVCIRCSGIHRGMGTHISRVKSVDLDSWTDEQLQSMLRWGNSRANKYWEAKLAPGHVPAEAKIENFIRTKYDSKRWVMDGPMPDPATLETNGDDDVPLNVVQEKAKLDRSSSQRNGASSGQPAVRRNNNIDLFGDEPSPAPARPSTTEPAISSRPPPVKGPAAPPKQTRPGDSLLGLDFLGGTQSAPPARPSSATSGLMSSGLPQRTDLKQSILSLYSSAPRTAAPPAQTTAGSFSGLSSPPTQAQNPPASTQSFGGLGDAFSSLSFTSPASQQPPAKTTPLSNFGSPGVPWQPSVTSTSSQSSGGFFDSNPTQARQPIQPAASKPQTQRMSSGFGDFGDFTSAAPTKSSVKAPPAATSTMGDLFDLSGPAPAPKPTPSYTAPAPTPATGPSYKASSAFNLSTPAPAISAKPAAVNASKFTALDNSDAWGSSDAWSTPDPAPATASVPAPAPKASVASPSYKAPATATVQADFGGWGSNDSSGATQPAVTQDDDFGGWSSASPVATPAATSATAPQSSAKAPSKGFGGGDDLFGNVWE